MIKIDNIIKADKGKTLYYIPEDRLWGGPTARLANYKDHLLVEDDFIELYEEDVIMIDGKNYIFIGWSYSDIKTFIIKLHYSNDNQIALILNYQLNPDKYEVDFKKMQEWRNYASEIATKYGS